MEKYKDIKQLLKKIYGKEKGRQAFTKINVLMEKISPSQKREKRIFFAKGCNTDYIW